jgi:hypothetical protein
MQFGTTNAPVDFQGYINNAIWEALDHFPSANLDDILRYNESEEDHVGHVKWVMQRLLEVGLPLMPEKCEFHKETVWYLGLIISTKRFLWTTIRWKVCGIGAGKWKRKMAGCITLFQYNNSSASVIIIGALSISILRKRNYWQGLRRRMNAMYADWNNTWPLRGW